ncbi:MAG: hypothetical protein WBN66_02260 [Smithella sp.]
MNETIGPRWYVRESFTDKLRRLKITAFLVVVILSGLVQFGWQVLTKEYEE